MVPSILKDLRDAAKFCFNSRVRTALTSAVMAPVTIAAAARIGAAVAPVAAVAALAGLTLVATRMDQFHNWRKNGMLVTTFGRKGSSASPT